jgi:YfiH family protein
MKIGNFNLNKKDDLMYLTIPTFEKFNNLFHIFTTRIPNDFDLGINTETPLKKIYHNYEKLAKVFNLNLNDFVLSDQIHEDNVLVVDESYKSNNFLYERKIKNTDALITNKKNIILVTLYADCTPIYFFDPKNNVIGLAHSGWKGTIKKIAEKTVKKMQNVYNSNPEDILVALGPSIGPNSFEVREDVKILFEKTFPKNINIIKKKDKEKYLINIWKAIEYTLINTGIKKENILISDIDTYSNTDLFFSYRKEGKTGRMAAIMALIDK